VNRFVARGLQLAFFAAALEICLYQGPTTRAFNQDNQIYFFISERVASGVPPHVSLVDHKNALSSILSGAAIYAGRRLGVDDVLSARVLSMTVAAATVASVWALATELAGTWLAGTAAAFVMLNFVDFFMQGTMGVRPKVFMAFFMVWALLAFVRNRPARAGLWATASFLCWQPALLVLGSIGLASLVARDRIARTARVVAGAALAMLAYEGYFAAYGALGEQLTQSLRMPADLTGYKVDPLLESLGFVVRMGLWRNDAIWVFPAAFLAALVLAWIGVLVRPTRTWALVRERYGWQAMVIVSTTALAFTLFNHQAYPDMFFLQPLIAVICGAVVGRLAEAIGPPPLPRRLVAYAVAGAFGVACSWLVYQRVNYFGGDGGANAMGLAYQRALSREVVKLRDQYGPVWAIGCPHLLAFQRMENFSQFSLLIDPKVRSYLLSQTGGQPYYPRKDGQLPAVILTARGGERKVIPWLPRYYRRLPRQDFEQTGVRVWIYGRLFQKGASDGARGARP